MQDNLFASSGGYSYRAGFGVVLGLALGELNLNIFVLKRYLSSSGQHLLVRRANLAQVVHNTQNTVLLSTITERSPAFCSCCD